MNNHLPQAQVQAQAPLATIPPDIRCARDYEVLAERFMAPPHYAYVAGGSGDDLTVAANLAAFSRWNIWPRLLRDMRAGHTRVTIAGEHLAHPLFLAPVAFQNLAHARGELETARAAHATDTCLITSTLASHSLEDVARAAGPQRWFQLYFQPRQDDTQDLLERACNAGYRAIVVTLDASVQVPSLRALRAGFRMPATCIAVNLAANLADHDRAEAIALAPGESRIFQGIMRTAPTWSDLASLLQTSPLPVWVKGVLHAADAVKLQQAGCAGLIVSNHGGRSLDGAPASLDALPAIRAALGSAFPLLFDGGIRSGSDVFKALALGADGVLIGRLQMYALGVAGGLGVAHMITMLREELEVCMAMAGCATVQEIERGALEPGALVGRDLTKEAQPC
jgi:isopentenyl diphosphate isomerase/L-lactate dehydrogenase-like FMN-dependent dehydrogenase